MDPLFMLDHAIKAQQWEIAKGHLRALVALQGAYQTAAGRDTGTEERWRELDRRVKAFIQEIEDWALHE